MHLELWKSNWNSKLFFHISTDEVYGSLGPTGLFKENSSVNQIHHIQHQKLALIILLDHMVKLMNCLI